MTEPDELLSYRPVPSLSDIDLRLLRVFHTIVRSKGFSAAQYELNMSQPAISSHMKQLEDRLGIRLCERGRSGFKLTDGGEVVYCALQNLFQSIDEFHSDVTSYKEQLSGDLYVALDDATATNPKSPFRQMLQKLTRDAPEVEIHLSIAPPAELEAGVLEDRYHLAIAPFRDVADSLQCHPVHTEKETLYCGKRHPLFERSLTVTDACELSGMRYVARGFMDRAGNLENVTFSQRAYASNMEVLVALLLTGDYIGYVARHFAQLWVDNGELRPIAEDQLSYSSQFHTIMRTTQGNPAALFALKCLTDLAGGSSDPSRSVANRSD